MSVQPRVDPIACRGHALCAELLPEHITADEWGYPIVQNPVPDKQAKRAAAACPALALRLEPVRRL